MRRCVHHATSTIRKPIEQAEHHRVALGYRNQCWLQADQIGRAAPRPTDAHRQPGRVACRIKELCSLEEGPRIDVFSAGSASRRSL